MSSVEQMARNRLADAYDLRGWKDEANALRSGMPMDSPTVAALDTIAAALREQPEACPHEAREEDGGWCKCVDCGHGWSAASPSPPVEQAARGGVDEAMAERFCRRWYEVTGRSLERAYVLTCLDAATGERHG